MNAADPRQEDEARPPGLRAGLSAFLSNLAGLLGNRAELAALELGEVRDNLVRLAALGALGLLALLFALGSWTGLVVVLAWDALGWIILLLVALAWSIAAILLFTRIKALMVPGALSLPATMAELRKDRDALLQGENHA